MKLHELKPNPGARHSEKRVGRGIGSGHGVTATRGSKGQKARSGGNIPAWYEGGQTPLLRRLPVKRGFHNPFRVEYLGVNLSRISELVEASGASEITPALLAEHGITRGTDERFKILSYGDIGVALTVRAHGFSQSARQKIEAAGGRVVIVDMDNNEVTDAVEEKAGKRELRRQAGLEKLHNAKRLSTRAQMRAEGKEIVKGATKKAAAKPAKGAQPAQAQAKKPAAAGGKKK